MRSGSETIKAVVEDILTGRLPYRDNVVIGDNSSGKTLLLKLFIERAKDSENIYFIDAVNRGFDVTKISRTEKKPEYKRTILDTRLQETYSSLPGAEIILQPMGVNGMDTREPLALQYDVLEMACRPAKDTYSDRECRFIDAHIKRFRLNDPRYRSRQLFDFVKNVIDSEGKIPMYECNNMITEIFRRKLLGRTQEEALKICQSIFIIAFPKM